MSKHTIRRNGRLYDELDSDTHAVRQIARSYAKDMTGDEFTCHDESGEEYYAIKISHPHTWRVANGPFTTGGDVSERRKGDKQ